MRKHKKRTFFSISILVLAASFSGTGQPMVDGFSYRFGPAVKGQPLSVHAEYNDRDCPVYEITIRVFTSKNKDTLLYTGNTVSGKLSDSYPTFYHDEEVPAYYTRNYNSLYLEMTFRNKADWLWIDYYNNVFAWNITQLGQSLSLRNPPLNSKKDTNRWVVIKDYGTLSAYRETDSYYFGYWNIYPQSSLYHGVRVQNFVLGFHGGANGTNALLGKVALYIFTHPEEWSIGTQTIHESKRCVRIPCRLVELSTYVDSETSYTYQLYNVETETTYAVSRQDYTMLSNAPNQKDYFMANDVFIPIRNGYENDTYTFLVRYLYLSSYSDSFAFDFTMNKGTTLFGNCEDADYCVTLGRA